MELGLFLSNLKDSLHCVHGDHACGFEYGALYRLSQHRPELIVALIGVAEAADFDVGIWHSQTQGHDRATCTTTICKRLRDLEALAGGR